MLEIQLDGMLMGRKLSESSWHHFLHWRLPTVQLPRMAEMNIRNAAGGRHSGHLRPADLGFSQWTFWFWRAKALEAPDIWIRVKRTNCWHGELQWVWMKCELWWHTLWQFWRVSCPNRQLHILFWGYRCHICRQEWYQPVLRKLEAGWKCKTCKVRPTRSGVAQHRPQDV